MISYAVASADAPNVAARASVAAADASVAAVRDSAVAAGALVGWDAFCCCGAGASGWIWEENERADRGP